MKSVSIWREQATCYEAYNPFFLSQYLLMRAIMITFEAL